MDIMGIINTWYMGIMGINTWYVGIMGINTSYVGVMDIINTWYVGIMDNINTWLLREWQKMLNDNGKWQTMVDGRQLEMMDNSYQISSFWQYKNEKTTLNDKQWGRTVNMIDNGNDRQ